MTDFSFTRYWKQLRKKQPRTHTIQVSATEWDFIQNLPDDPDPVVVERWKQLPQALIEEVNGEPRNR